MLKRKPEAWIPVPRSTPDFKGNSYFAFNLEKERREREERWKSLAKRINNNLSFQLQRAPDGNFVKVNPELMMLEEAERDNAAFDATPEGYTPEFLLLEKTGRMMLELCGIEPYTHFPTKKSLESALEASAVPLSVAAADANNLIQPPPSA